MDLRTELARLTLDTPVSESVLGAVRQLLDHAQKSATAELVKYREQLAQRDAQLLAATTKNQALVLELAHLKRMRYGLKSETLSAQIRDLFDETLDSDIAAAQAKLDQLAKDVAPTVAPATTPKPPRRNAGRGALPEHLPRIEHRHEPDSCTCADCGQERVKIGEDISEQLDVEPARFFVHRHIRPQYACRHCETVAAAPIPPAVIDGGLASVGLLTWVAISKYLDHQPLYRLEDIALRSGVTIARSTMAAWIGRIGVAVQPLADRLGELLRARDVLHADETPVQQLDPGSGKTHRAYLWAYRSTPLDSGGRGGSGPPIVVFDYQTSRAGRHAQAFLGDWQGALMVDDYAGYKALFAGGIIELACWAHVRRKFVDLNEAQPNAIAQEALRRIAVLYAIEKQAVTMGIEERTRLRHAEAKPVLDSLKQWLLTTRVNVANGGGTAKAMDYTLRRWAALTRYADDGVLPIDNNPVENAIRPIALGRKNWLFVGSERAGERAASIQSLLATAKLNGLNPAAWLRDTLEKLPTCLNSQIDSLLPFTQRA
jgi:transposase